MLYQDQILRVFAFSVMRHVVPLLYEALLQRIKHLLQLALLGTHKVQLRLETHLILFDSVNRVAQRYNLVKVN